MFNIFYYIEEMVTRFQFSSRTSIILGVVKISSLLRRNRNSKVSIKSFPYRSDIDGLRALAVISVIFYHAKVGILGREWFSGGFIGVDVFFVISGYLITKLLITELNNNGSINLTEFYQRRARRILPMLFCVVFVSFPFAWERLLPRSFIEYAESILTALFFSSNYFFYFNTTEYGADSSLLKPFLHTWSLGVEGQFYLIFPVFVLFAFKYFPKWLLFFLLCLSLIGFIFMISVGSQNQTLNFYSPISRFWQLMVGSSLAYLEFNKRFKQIDFKFPCLSSIGLILIIFCAIYFDSTTTHPGILTLLPVAGAALIIASNDQNDISKKILSLKPFIGIGLISYSAYLWHFPILAFSRLGNNQLSFFDKIELIALTFILSIVSFFLIERPFRRRLSDRSFVLFSSLSFIIISLACSFIILSRGVANEYRLGFDPSITSSDFQNLLVTSKPNYLFGDKSCEEDFAVYQHDTQFCIFGNIQKHKIDFMLLGDSHAMHSQPLLNKIGLEKNLKGAFGGNSGCPPLLGVFPVRGQPHPNDEAKLCFSFNQHGFEMIKLQDIKTVILIARWDYYVDGGNTGSLNEITDESLIIGDINAIRQLYAESVRKTFELYKKEGVKVVVLLQVPHQNINIKQFLEGAFSKNKFQKGEELEIFSNDSIQTKDHRKKQEIASSPWLQLAKNNDLKDLIVIDPTNIFCEAGHCPFMSKGDAFYTDHDHPSEIGFARLENQFLRAFGY